MSKRCIDYRKKDWRSEIIKGKARWEEKVSVIHQMKLPICDEEQNSEDQAKKGNATAN